MINVKFSELRLWYSIALVFLYIIVGNFFADYVVSIEMDGFVQMFLTFVFLVYTYYTIKVVYRLWNPKSNVKQSKKKKK